MKYATYKPRYTTNEWQPICDQERWEYLLLKFVSGKNGESGIKYPIFHLRLKNGKVLVEENNTDSDIIGELLELGIEKRDIVMTSYIKQTDLALA